MLAVRYSVGSVSVSRGSGTQAAGSLRCGTIEIRFRLGTAGDDVGRLSTAEMQLGGVTRCHRGCAHCPHHRWLAARAMISQFRFSRLAGTVCCIPFAKSRIHGIASGPAALGGRRSRSQTQQSRRVIRWPYGRGPVRKPRVSLKPLVASAASSLHARCRIRRCMPGLSQHSASSSIEYIGTCTYGHNRQLLLFVLYTVCCMYSVDALQTDAAS